MDLGRMTGLLQVHNMATEAQEVCQEVQDLMITMALEMINVEINQDVDLTRMAHMKEMDKEITDSDQDRVQVTEAVEVESQDLIHMIDLMIIMDQEMINVEINRDVDLILKDHTTEMDNKDTEMTDLVQDQVLATDFQDQVAQDQDLMTGEINKVVGGQRADLEQDLMIEVRMVFVLESMIAGINKVD